MSLLLIVAKLFTQLQTAISLQLASTRNKTPTQFVIVLIIDEIFRALSGNSSHFPTAARRVIGVKLVKSSLELKMP